MSTKIFIFTSLLALSSALRTTLTERRQVNTECWQTNPGTQFYRCINGYVGCFAKDPCALPPLSTATPSIPSDIPVSTTHEITESRSYNIYPRNGADESDLVPHVDLQKSATEGIVRTNALVFDNVPENAKNCRLQWRSDKADDPSFFVVGAGQVYSRQLLGFPSSEDPVTYKSLKPFQDTQKDLGEQSCSAQRPKPRVRETGCGRVEGRGGGRGSEQGFHYQHCDKWVVSYL
jgi:hypothetical protein